MQTAADAIPFIIKCRSQRLADAGRVVAMTPPPRHTRNQSGTQEPLCIDDVVEVQVTDGAQAGGDLAHGRWRIQRLSPAPPRNRDDVSGRGMESHEWRESFLDEPRKGRVRMRLARVNHGRHMMNYIAERSCLDEEDVGHGAFVALIYRSLRVAAITMPSDGAIRTQFLLSTGTLPHVLGSRA